MTEAPVHPWKVWVEGMPVLSWEYFEDADDALRFALPYIDDPGERIRVMWLEEPLSVAELIDSARPITEL